MAFAVLSALVAILQVEPEHLQPGRHLAQVDYCLTVPYDHIVCAATATLYSISGLIATCRMESVGRSEVVGQGRGSEYNGNGKEVDQQF